MNSMMLHCMIYIDLPQLGSTYPGSKRGVVMTTDLARAWEKDEEVRTNARSLAAVSWL